MVSHKLQLPMQKWLYMFDVTESGTQSVSAWILLIKLVN
jgi:hypothetical protein